VGTTFYWGETRIYLWVVLLPIPGKGCHLHPQLQGICYGCWALVCDGIVETVAITAAWVEAVTVHGQHSLRSLLLSHDDVIYRVTRSGGFRIYR